ncbi:MAG TPA: IS3 family transposase [Candidatus Dormibacteraeota bacterium]|nr:IS3 family transposase [Candidatus Dormibacteraeota bacterium]
MKGRKHTPEQIVRKLREGERLIAEGKTLGEVAKVLEVSDYTYVRWRNRYGGLKADDAKELRRLKDENGRLKRVVADLTLDNAMLREAAPGKLLSPARRRDAVRRVRERFGVSERRACRALGQHRTTQRRPPRPVLAPEEQLRRRMRKLGRAQPRYGYRRIWALLRQEGWLVNRKRVQRIWREEGLRVPAQSPKRRRLGVSTVPADRLRAERPNHVWALDFIFDATSDGRPLKALSMCDEFTRENLARRIGRSITSDAVVDALDEAYGRRGAPEFIRCDNGPEFVAAAIRDWCRFMGTGTAYIEPGSPWENPYVESFNGKLRDELFAREVFDSVMEARILFDDWADVYNRYRPHNTLGYLAPAVFAAAWDSHQGTG